MKTALSIPVNEIRSAVRANKLGEHNKSKDFVPSDSTDDRILKSTKNAYSRKATLIWMDKLPQDLVQKLKQGTFLACMRIPIILVVVHITNRSVRLCLYYLLYSHSLQSPTSNLFQHISKLLSFLQLRHNLHFALNRPPNLPLH